MKKTAKKSRLTLKQLAREVDELRELTARLAEVVNKHLKGHNETVLKAPSVGVVCRAIREMSGIVDNNSRASYNNDVRLYNSIHNLEAVIKSHAVLLGMLLK